MLAPTSPKTKKFENAGHFCFPRISGLAEQSLGYAFVILVSLDATIYTAIRCTLVFCLWLLLPCFWRAFRLSCTWACLATQPAVWDKSHTPTCDSNAQAHESIGASPCSARVLRCTQLIMCSAHLLALCAHLQTCNIRGRVVLVVRCTFVACILDASRR